MVQDILSDMNDDEVSSISDTLESLQVAQIIKSTYFEIIDSKTWPHLRKLFELEASSDSEKPTHMGIPENCREVEFVQYNKKKLDSTRDYFEVISYVTPDEFLRRTSLYDNTLDYVDRVVDYSGVSILIKNDRHPEFWTSFDDETIVFNSYDSTVDTTLKQSSTRVSGYIDPVWSMSDSFVPDLPSEMFSYLLAEAKSTAMLRLKQAPDQKAEQQSIRQRHKMSRDSRKQAGGIRLPDYARRSRK